MSNATSNRAATSRMIWAGGAAIVGGLAAVMLTAPLAAAYFRAYPGFDVPPFWLSFVEQGLSPMLEFASPVTVYETYGRIYGVVLLLYLPATVLLHRLRLRGTNRVETIGFGLVLGALVITAVGVAGDYWAGGIGYVLVLPGLLGLAIGSTVWGVGIRRDSVVPAWWAWLLIAVGPLSVVFLFLLGHIPSGPAFPFALAWFVLGCLLVTGRVSDRGGSLRKGPRHPHPPVHAGEDVPDGH